MTGLYPVDTGSSPVAGPIRLWIMNDYIKLLAKYGVGLFVFGVIWEIVTAIYDKFVAEPKRCGGRL